MNFLGYAVSDSEHSDEEPVPKPVAGADTDKTADGKADITAPSAPDAKDPKTLQNGKEAIAKEAEAAKDGKGIPAAPPKPGEQDVDSHSSSDIELGIGLKSPAWKSPPKHSSTPTSPPQQKKSQSRKSQSRASSARSRSSKSGAEKSREKKSRQSMSHSKELEKENSKTDGEFAIPPAPTVAVTMELQDAWTALNKTLISLSADDQDKLLREGIYKKRHYANPYSAAKMFETRFQATESLKRSVEAAQSP